MDRRRRSVQPCPERGASALWAVTIGRGERLVDESVDGIRLAINGLP